MLCFACLLAEYSLHVHATGWTGSNTSMMYRITTHPSAAHGLFNHLLAIFEWQIMNVQSKTSIPFNLIKLNRADFWIRKGGPNCGCFVKFNTIRFNNYLGLQKPDLNYMYHTSRHLFKFQARQTILNVTKPIFIIVASHSKRERWQTAFVLSKWSSHISYKRLQALICCCSGQSRSSHSQSYNASHIYSY